MPGVCPRDPSGAGRRLRCDGAARLDTSERAPLATAHGSTGRGRPGSPPHGDVLLAVGSLLAEDSDPAPRLSDKDASWHDRAQAERRRGRRRLAVTRLRAAAPQSAPRRPWELDLASPPAATSGPRLSPWRAGRASAETTRR